MCRLPPQPSGKASEHVSTPGQKEGWSLNVLRLPTSIPSLVLVAHQGQHDVVQAGCIHPCGDGDIGARVGWLGIAGVINGADAKSIGRVWCSLKVDRVAAEHRAPELPRPTPDLILHHVARNTGSIITATPAEHQPRGVDRARRAGQAAAGCGAINGGSTHAHGHIPGLVGCRDPEAILRAFLGRVHGLLGRG